MRDTALRILVIDDNPGDAELLREALADVPEARTELAWEATLASGLERLQRERFDVVVLDLTLPDSRGLGTLSRVRRGARHVPVVVLTGLDDRETGLRAVQEGAQDYLVKGRVDGELLWRSLAYAVQRQRADDAVRILNAELERRVEARTRELRLANEELASFVRSASHDLRSPVRTIEGFAHLLLDEHGAQLDVEGRRLVQRIQRAAVKLDAMLDGLLRFSTLTDAALERRPVDLTALARRLVADLARRDADRSVAVEIEDGLVAVADEGLIEIALENLIGNAWKFTRHAPEARIRIGTVPGRRPTVYYVEDTGVGFDPAMADRLFRPFQRLHPEREFPGAGLGLATVRRVVRLHGGRLWAEGRPGRGATFYFTLEPEPPSSGAEPATETPAT